jgi:hypothetical protein
MRAPSLALICPCGECPLDPSLWECRECASTKELDEADAAYAEFLASREGK